jgi:flagellar biosynthesis protein FliR
MHADLTFQLAALYGFLFTLARVSGVLVFVPIPGFSVGPDASRVVLALALTFALFPASSMIGAGKIAAAGGGPDGSTLAVGNLAGGIVRETFFGMTVGLAVAFLLEGVQLAAQALGLQAGYSYASTVDPNTQADTTTLQLMAQLLAGMLFFAFGFDRQVLSALARSFAAGTGSGLFGDGNAVEAITRLGAGIFATGIQLAMPVLALLVLLDIAFAVLGRLHAQLQLLSLSFAIKMLTALFFLASVLSMYPGVFERSGALTFAVLDRVLNR